MTGLHASVSLRASHVILQQLFQYFAANPAVPCLRADAPALLDSTRQGLVPLVRQGRRGPAVDLDAFLLVVMNEYCDGEWVKVKE